MRCIVRVIRPLDNIHDMIACMFIHENEFALSLLQEMKSMKLSSTGGFVRILAMFSEGKCEHVCRI